MELRWPRFGGAIAVLGHDHRGPTVTSHALYDALVRARALGVLGPGPVEDHLAHAGRFVEALAPVDDGGLVVDLGSGAGVPGLVLAESRPGLRFLLLDAMEKRTALLEEAVAAMGIAGRVSVATGRAEELGRLPVWRAGAAAVVARSFGPPPVVAECAAPLLGPGGRLVVSEPPDHEDRWPLSGLQLLGLTPAPDDGAVGGVRIFSQTEPCPERYPRRVGVPRKRPLF